MAVVIGLLGLLAGIVTTLAGAGGGVLLIAALSLVLGPHLALATSAPTLLVGNVHRLVLYRKHVDPSVALPVMAGAVPGSLLAGALAMSLPQTLLQILFLTVTGYSVARALALPLEALAAQASVRMYRHTPRDKPAKPARAAFSRYRRSIWRPTRGLTRQNPTPRKSRKIGESLAVVLGVPAWTPGRALLVPAGAIVGGVSATSGGAGLLLSPLLLSSGLSGERYIATSAAVALSTHAARLAAYVTRGVVTREVLGYAGIATVTIVIGNMLGDRLRPFVAAPRRASFVEHGTLAVCAALGVAGLR